MSFIASWMYSVFSVRFTICLFSNTVALLEGLTLSSENPNLYPPRLAHPQVPPHTNRHAPVGA